MFSVVPAARLLASYRLRTHILQRFSSALNIPEFDAAKEKLLEMYKSMTTQLEQSDAKTASSDFISRWNRLRPIGEHLLGLEFLQKSEAETEIMLRELMGDEDRADLHEIAAIEKKERENQVEALNREILRLLVPPETYDDCDVLLEVSSGAGGLEAMLFAQELLGMYMDVVGYLGWTVKHVERHGTDMGGLRFGSLLVSGVNAYGTLKYEGGIHRVQRIPRTSGQGKIHTSTAAVAVLPRSDEVKIELKKEDLKFDTFKASGKGGQHVNTTDSAVRLTHLPSGTTAESQDTRSQNENRQIAMERLRVKLQDKIIAAEEEERSASVRLQVGGRNRSEKIRTYNFPQDRLTDHRLNRSWSNMARMMSEPAHFETVFVAMQKAARADRLTQTLRRILDEGWK